jgi:hypothetical protein
MTAKPPPELLIVRIKRNPRKRAGDSIPDSYYDLIGRVIVAWSSFEITIEILIWEILRLRPNAGRQITSRLDTRPKMEMLHAVAASEIKNKKVHAALAGLKMKVADLVADRNMIVHGVWRGAKPDRSVAYSFRKKAPGKGVYGQIFSDAKLKELVKDIKTCQMALFAIAVHFPPSIRKSRGPIHLGASTLVRDRPSKKTEG